MSLSYTLPLNDGALGTIPLTHQQPALALLKADTPRLAAAIRPLLSTFVATTARCIHKLGWLKAGRRLALYIVVSALELQLLVCAPVLFLAVPGLIFLPCVGLEVALLWLLVQRLNRNNNQQEVIPCTSAEGTTTTTTTAAKNSSSSSSTEHWHWIVVGGTDLDPETTREVTLPRLAALFASNMHAFIPRRLGLPLDIAGALLRTASVSVLLPTTARSAALYRAVRAQLLRSRKKKSDGGGVRVLAHGTGAADVAWVLARLCADLPAGEGGLLARLQVFTFGAAAAEMTVPLGGGAQQQQQQGGDSSGPGGLYYPTVTHFAFDDDPFAQMGVFLGIRRRLEGRFVGSRISSKASGPSRFSQSRFLPRVPSYTLDDYLDALFPGGDPRAGVLGRVCRIDREVSETRELAALAQSVSNHRPDNNKKTTRADDGATKRLSWTVLGAVADSLSSSSSNGDRDQGGMDMDMAGAFSLNEARRRGKALEGMRGYENNALAEAAAAAAVLSFQWKRTGTGMGGDDEGADEDGDPSAINTYIPPATH
ncbi:hypothetical protein F5X96DRAFT_688272 [Biscogniauxia mediterranea]|nr:hypothetical protein F5X96DRAFT_688272 [Biscogniauxia mediterranea]